MVFGDARVCCDLILERFLPNNKLKKKKKNMGRNKITTRLSQSLGGRLLRVCKIDHHLN